MTELYGGVINQYVLDRILKSSQTRYDFRTWFPAGSSTLVSKSAYSLGFMGLASGRSFRRRPRMVRSDVRSSTHSMMPEVSFRGITYNFNIRSFAHTPNIV